MVNTFKKLGVVAALSLAFAASAHASTYVIGTSFDTDVYVAPSTGWFENAYTFNLSEAGTISFSFSEIETSFLNINLLQGSLFNAALNPVSGVLSSGVYTLLISGKSVGPAGGSYNLKFDVAAAAVPEPETNAMMLLGLGLMGVVAYRKKNMA